MDAADEFAWVHRSRQGRILHCPGIGRLVLDFQGSYFIFRPREFQRFRHHFSRLVSCSWSRCRLQEGEQISVQDSLGRNSLILEYPEVRELAELLETAGLLLEARGALEGFGIAGTAIG
jgi:hypothetical protein